MGSTLRRPGHSEKMYAQTKRDVILKDNDTHICICIYINTKRYTVYNDNNDDR